MSFWRSAPANWRRFRSLTPSERWILVESLILLPLSAYFLRLRGLGRVQRNLARFIPSRRARLEGTQSLDAAQMLARTVDLAAARGPWPANCLQRSVVTWWLLERRGINAEVRIGVRKVGSDPEFHAWVEHRGRVVNDEPDVGELYSPFDRALPPRGARFD